MKMRYTHPFFLFAFALCVFFFGSLVQVRAENGLHRLLQLVEVQQLGRSVAHLA